MTLGELGNVLETTGLPVAYLSFPEEEVPEMPFIVFQDTGSDNTGADNTVWFSGMKVQVDLLMAKKDREKEELLEGILTGANIFWERVPSFDEDEACHRTIYDIEI